MSSRNRPVKVYWEDAASRILNLLITLSDEPGEPSLLQQEKIAEEKARADLLADPNIAAVMDAFPEAELEPSTKGA